MANMEAFLHATGSSEYPSTACAPWNDQPLARWGELLYEVDIPGEKVVAVSALTFFAALSAVAGIASFGVVTTPIALALAAGAGLWAKRTQGRRFSWALFERGLVRLDGDNPIIEIPWTKVREVSRHLVHGVGGPQYFLLVRADWDLTFPLSGDLGNFARAVELTWAKRHGENPEDISDIL
jgi:hypothetical protein